MPHTLTHTFASAVTNTDNKTPSVTLLDGGMGRELEQRGAPFRQPEWSALALKEAPETVAAAHLDFIRAGSRIITINSYAVTPFHLGDRFYDEAKALICTASEMAAKAVADAKKEAENQNKALPKVSIAGCLPPLFGSYRPDLFDENLAESIAKPLIIHQQEVADIWLAETVSSIKEAVYWHHVVARFAAVDTDTEIKDTTEASKHLAKPFWVAFTLDDSYLDEITDTQSDAYLAQHSPKLRSGESIADAVKAMLELGVDAILFNCSQAEVMSSALNTAKQLIESADTHTQLGVYANAFAPKQNNKQANDQLRGLRQDTTPDNYLQWAAQWQQDGATIIGGCCGIGVDHIARLSEQLTQKSGCK